MRINHLRKYYRIKSEQDITQVKSKKEEIIQETAPIEEVKPVEEVSAPVEEPVEESVEEE